MRCGGKRGRVAYFLYRAASRGLSPFLFFHLQWRKLRGLEHPLRWPERLGHPSSPRPPGPLLWFHAVSLGMATIPVIKHCNQQQPNFTILMTTTTTSAFEVIKDRLPNGIIYQFAPIDTPAAVDAFLGYWKPNAVFLMESELWPNLIVSASEKGILVALLNARISAKSFKFWSGPTALPLISLMLSKFSLIAPLSTLEAIRFQLLQAPPFIINFAGDLKYAVGDVDVSEKENSKIEDLQLQLADRPVWMAASIHKGEDEVMILVHKALIRIYPSVVTIIVPRNPQHGRQISLALQREGLHVVLRSQTEKILPSTNFYVVDTLGELRSLYRLTPIAVLGGSFLPGLAGHNISEAAAAGCAVLTGPYVGHFSHMVLEMQQLNHLSVMQVSSKELMGALNMLLGNAEALEAHRLAAKQAFLALSSGVVRNVWNLIDAHVLKGLLGN
ncbi:probable 3-deoxy-D-manno-octulosonic acid transferase, mitochondrial isoform X2 [Magnolia sinica]|uniref:probable 3-deoxy-D-manno-octulosonic acid transferase, mitochondrial isoform X2 n=1 Tax=Magnolia sinica TaxID=86752 RepID=UPI0026594342|nr:probable 3-deoxy-D-manno-octulosonic acid transferase, mitochondrial isoform X2 [Magnolia sinica]